MDKNELVVKIMDLAYQIQVNTDFFIWISFAGHVNELEVRIAPKTDWKHDEGIIRFYVEGVSNNELLDNIELLENILNEKKGQIQTVTKD